MALKDLVSDLSNFKGQSQYGDLDNQIEKGVDFFPNTDAPGFTPKTDLESLYNSVKAPFAKEWPEAARSNEKTRNHYGAQGEYAELPGVGISNPSHTFTSDTILAPVNQPQFTSDFMTTPIADYTSNFYPTYPSPLTFDVSASSCAFFRSLVRRACSRFLSLFRSMRFSASSLSSFSSSSCIVSVTGL